MKKIQTPRRLLAFLMALIIIFGITALPAFADGMQVGDSSTISRVWLTEFGQYQTSSPNRWGEMQMLTLRKDGSPVYCIQYGVSFNGNPVTGTNLLNASAWTNLSRSAQTGIIRASLYGYPNNNFGVGNRAAYAATQLIIWEYELGYRTNATSDNSQFTSYINSNSDIRTA